MENQSDIYHYRYESWLFDQLNPDEQLMYRHYPAHQPTTRSEIMKDADKYPDRPVIDEAEQVRIEDEWLAKNGVL